MSSKVSRVVPVIDYEPPAYGGPPAPPPVAPVTRPRPVPPPPVPDAGDPTARDAALFADAALRRVLEVMDRRRPPAQLRPLLAAGLADSLPAATRAQGGGTARLRRVLARPVGSGVPRTAEVAASYVRGGRVGAIACRVEQVPGAAGPRWQVVALHLG